MFPPPQYAAKDAQRKAAIEAKNEADSLIYSGGCLRLIATVLAVNKCSAAQLLWDADCRATAAITAAIG